MKNRKILARAGIFLALGLILEYFSAHFIPRMPQGGRLISPGMIPLIIFALEYGPRWGIMLGAAFGILYYPLDPAAVHWAQVFLDYPLAFGATGLAGFFADKEGKAAVFAGIITGCTGRFVCHYLSGVIFFAATLPKTLNPWLGSLIYNGSYVIPTALFAMAVIPPIQGRMKTMLKESRHG